MAKIEGHIATRNNTHTIKVCIYNKNCNKPSIHIDASRSVKFADNPVTITQQQDDTFEHILKTQCKIRLVTKQWLGDYLFASNYSSIVVNVWVDNHCVFCGYVTPHTYNQNYSHLWEEVEINCVDLLSTLKDRRLTDIQSYEELTAQSCVRPFSWFIGNMDLDTKTVVIPNFPDIDYGEAEMMWYEVDWTRVVNEDGTITYYGIEAEIIILDEETAMNTGEMRQGEEKEVTWVDSEDTVIVDGLAYYKQYAHIIIAGNDTNTGDWRVGELAEGVMPDIVTTVSELDGWTHAVPPVPFEYYEHFTISYLYDNEMTIPIDTYIGDQIPEYPLETSYNSYWDLRQGPNNDLVFDETTSYYYYKNYGFVTVNEESENSGDWVRGQRHVHIRGKVDTTAGYLEPWPYLNINNIDYTPEYDETTGEFVFDLPIEVAQNITYCYFHGTNYGSIPNIVELYFVDFDTSNTYQFGFWGQGGRAFFGMLYYQPKLVTLDMSILDTSQMNNMSRMFSGCSLLTSLDLTNFNTSNVTDMSSMFSGCSSLTSLDLSNFDTSYLKTPSVSDFQGMYNMFAGCSSLTSLDLSYFDTTSDFLHMEYMFHDCASLTSLNLSNWDLITTRTKKCDNMFDGCTSLTSITMNNTSDGTFNKITYINTTYLPTTVTIYRDGSTYLYNSNTNTWEIQ